MTHRYVLLAAAPEEVGLLALLQRWLRGHGAVPATDVLVITDPDQQTTFARVDFECLKDLKELKADLHRISATWPLDAWHLQPRQRPRVLVLAGRKDHRLHGFLALHQQGRLDGNIVAVASSLQPLQALVEVYNVRFVHVDPPSDPDEGTTSHDELMRVVAQTEADFVVMTRTMQILPNQVITQEPSNVERLWPIPTLHNESAEVRLGEITALLTAVRWHARGELLIWRGHTVRLGSPEK